MECLRMDWKIQKWSHKCYAWGRSQMLIHGHKWGQHWVCMWQTSDLMEWQIVCKLIIILPTKSSTTDLCFIKSVQDGSQNSSQCCINKHTWTFGNNIWIAMTS
jgi:hypothetical protein